MLEVWRFKVEMYTEFSCCPEDPCVAFTTSGQVLLNKNTGGVLHPDGYRSFLQGKPLDAVYLGTWEERRCYAIILPDADEGSFLGEASLRDVLPSQHAEQGCLACMGKQLLYWRQQTRFCSVCATELMEKKGERARICPKCKNLYYPRINPAVIVSVHRGERILLAHNRSFLGGVYSLVAGYVEAGESLEQAVVREVFEEVGIHVRNIRYWGSQAWPFPSSLMMGFLADYDSGEIRPDGDEIDQAGWFTFEDLPPLPRKGSIARRIIESLMPESKREK